MGVKDRFFVNAPSPTWMNRRALLKASAGLGATAIAGLSFGCSEAERPMAAAQTTPLNLYLSVTPDSRILMTCPATEIGQGVTTSLPQILAEELGIEWQYIDVVVSGADEALANPGKSRQSVGQSYSVRGYYDALRTLGAGTRQAILQAAARRWGTQSADCVISGTSVTHAGSDQSISLHDLAEDIAAIEMDGTPRLKSRTEFNKIGRDLPRKDVPSKVDGTAQFASDVTLENMAYAALRFAPIGADFGEIDLAAIEAEPGILKAFITTVGLRPALAVVADRWWTADQAAKAAEFETSGTSSNVMKDAVRAALDGPAITSVGPKAPLDVDAPGTITASYDVPYLAHATMEPMSAVADVTENGCTLYAGAQSQTATRDAVAKALSIPAENVTIKTTYGGGGFGRRWFTDFPVLAAEISKTMGRPIKLLFSREADMACDYYRPAAAARFSAQLDEAGMLSSLDLKVAGQSILEYGRPGRLRGGVDPTSVGGLKDQPYACENLAVTWAPVEADVPVGVWRSVGHSQNGFFLESFIDEVARASGQDPMAFRKAHLGEHPRLVAVMEALSLSCCWADEKPAGIGRGLAIGEAYGSMIAYVVEVQLTGEKSFKINRISCAFDCGTAVNPLGVKTQIEGSIVYALSAALWGDVEIENGEVLTANFDTYPLLSLAQTPPIDVTIIETADAPIGGVGEPGVPPLAPALVNAIADASGVRLRTLPLSAAGWELA